MDHPHTTAHQHSTGSVLLDRGWRYDLEVWVFDTFLARGRMRQLRRSVLDLAQLRAGESLLDVGCGTGTLAIEAAGLVAGLAKVVGVDPAPRQLARATSKARKTGVAVDFRSAYIEHLPFADNSFDVVFSTLMLHHLAEELRRPGLIEIQRVLTPEGRLVVADFVGSTTDDADLSTVLADAGMTVQRRDEIPFQHAHRGWSRVEVLAAVAS